MLNIGVIGCGYWGPNVVRNFAELATARVVMVSDLNPERLIGIQRRYPDIRTTTDYRQLIADDAIEAVAIATPPRTHFPIALEALQAGKHLLVEKPLATSSAEAERLVHEAEQRDLILMVDHTYVYTDAVQKMKEILDQGHLGRLYYYKSERVNLGLFQQDVDVMWDLAVHDLAILDFLVGLEPESVVAFAQGHIPHRHDDIAFLTLRFPNQFIGHIHVNWLSPVKRREIVLAGERQSIIFDDIEPSEKIRVYDSGVDVVPEEPVDEASNPVPLVPQLNYRNGDIWTPRLSLTEALHTESLHFIDCIEGQKQPLTDGHAGLRVIRVLEAATQSKDAQSMVVPMTARAVSAVRTY